MVVAVPSKGRAGRTTTDKILKSATFFVPESEVHQYEGRVKNVVGVPISVKGITETRNWILKNNPGYVVFVDDDVKNAGYTRLLERNAKQSKLRDEGFWMEEFWKWFDTTEQMGYKIWGVKTEGALRSTYPYMPVNMRSYVTASMMGMVNDGEYMFNPEYPVKEDYEICLRHIRDKGGIFAVRYLYWENSHWSDDGGCRDYRTIAMEKEAIERLKKDYPGYIKSVKLNTNEFRIQLNL